MKLGSAIAVVTCVMMLSSLLACADDPSAVRNGAAGTAAVGGAGGDNANAGTGLQSGPGDAGDNNGWQLSGDANLALGDACATAEIATMRVVPTVWLLVDGSGSMGTALSGAGPSRWTVLREALVDANSGLVKRLQESVAFGLLVYDGGNSLPGMAGPQCPRVIAVPPATNNLAVLSSMYPAMQTGASTPTHYALLDLKKRIDAAGPSALGPTYVVLATDGKPNLCDFHDGIPATEATDQEALGTVGQLAAAGIKSFVISLAGAEADVQAHLEQVAIAGDTGTPAFSPTSKDDLAAALMKIIGATATCDVRIKGRVEVGRECTGMVKLDGTPLICNDPNGYHLKEDRTTLELVGSACTALQASAAATLVAAFPCQDVVPE